VRLALQPFSRERDWQKDTVQILRVGTAEKAASANKKITIN
jgi:hypothetical protein